MPIIETVISAIVGAATKKAIENPEGTARALKKLASALNSNEDTPAQQEAASTQEVASPAPECLPQYALCCYCNVERTHSNWYAPCTKRENSSRHKWITYGGSQCKGAVSTP